MILFRLAYADYLASILPSTLNLLYDIGCKLQAHWKVCTMYEGMLYYLEYNIALSGGILQENSIDNHIVHAEPDQKLWKHLAGNQKVLGGEP